MIEVLVYDDNDEISERKHIEDDECDNFIETHAGAGGLQSIYEDCERDHSFVTGFHLEMGYLIVFFSDLSWRYLPRTDL